MRHLFWLFALTLFLLLPDNCFAEDMVTVKLVNYVGEEKELTFQVKGKFVTLDPGLQLKEGVKYTLLSHKGNLYIQRKGQEKIKITEPLILTPYEYDEEHQVIIEDRPYLGAMQFKLEKEFIRPVNQLPLEDYLKGVVPYEVFPSWGQETLKAQTLAARTYAVANRKQIIDDTISYQVYGGYAWDVNTTKAVEATKDEVITYRNQLIETFYSASNGGMTESNVNVWGGKAKKYFPIKEDPYDPAFTWNFSLHKTQIDLMNMELNSWDSLKEKDEKITASMKTWLQRNGYPGEIKITAIPKFELSNTMLASKRSVKGSITIEFLRRLPEGTILFEWVELIDEDLDRIRPMIGGAIFKSYFIDSLELKGDKYTMSGKGYGHGVGMSQWGAHHMGQSGKQAEEIIEFYYPGTKIKKISDL